MTALVLQVRLHDGRYHGQGDWPPSPARLFQALVAGAGLGGPIGNAEKQALEWLEKLAPPLVAAPLAWRPRRGVVVYMPNNDSDAIAGDPLRMPEIRTATKTLRPYLFDATVPFLYAWRLAGETADESRAHAICSLAECLYQLGRGIDMAWAWGEVLDDRDLDELFTTFPGRLFRPSAGASFTTLPSPCPGSLESLERRHRAFGARFRYVMDGRAVKVVFRRPPGPRFRDVSYDNPPSRQLYELRDPIAEASFAPWTLERVSSLVLAVRDAAVANLQRAMPHVSAQIQRILVGRKPDGTNDGPPEDRVRIIPLPSVGHVHADREIRRVLIEVPPTCPLRAADVHWAFSGLDVVDFDTGEIKAVLIRTDNVGFLSHYGVNDDGNHRVWRTVTPVVLPEEARRRRIDPARKRDEAKAGRERAGEQERAAAAVCQALRHAGVRTGVETIRVQREPFEANGARVETFAGGTRFAKERLWHVEVAFKAPVPGPLAIGNGRFLGLGVLAPVATMTDIHVFAIESGLIGVPEPKVVAQALRRAVMARVQAVLEGKPLPAFFSGHESVWARARAPRSSHFAFLCDLPRSRLIIIAPHTLDRRDPTSEERECLSVLDGSLQDMRELRAGSAGVLKLRAIAPDCHTDPLFGASRIWESVTPYRVTRHSRGVTAEEALAMDLRAECRRVGLPTPRVQILQCRAVARRDIEGTVQLHFHAGVHGPLVLGRSRHESGGVFASKRAL
jgi:CRISPR-associated protein Csb2